mmetsp:Transcript_14684/g.34846  ORF Transcript_14684/g.34846 Transcript_14684/m.34846 type:complete len:615 (+) Transcript_14684:172-2016(+)
MRYGAITRVLIAAAVFLSANNHVTSGATSAMARTASIRQANTIESVTRRATNPVHNKNAITLVPDIETNLRPAPASPSPAREPARGRTYGMQLRKLRTKSEADISPQYMDSWRETSAQTDANPIRELLAPWLACFGVERQMTRMGDEERDPERMKLERYSFARMVNTRRRRLSTLSRSAYFKPDLSIREGDFIRESSFNSHWTASEAHIMLKAMRESPIAPAPMRRRRWKPGDKPPPLLAVPEEVPGQPVVAGAVMSGTQGLDMGRAEESSDLLHKRLDVLCLLDLDMTCFWGNDANDLGCAVQWNSLPKEQLYHLYNILWNPQADSAIRDIQSTHNVDVVIYTMRATLLTYRSPFRRLTLALKWEPEWHYEQLVMVDNEAVNQHVLCIPAHVQTAADILDTYSGVEELLDREKTDLGLCFERLLTARDVLKERLGLSHTPKILVTNTVKDVVFAARCVGHVGGNARAFLWDDNEKLWNRRNVIPVDKFDTLPEPAYSELQRFLQTHLPADKLDQGLVRFLQGAPAATRVLEEILGGGCESEGAKVEYVIPRASHVPPTWSLPVLPGLKDQRYGLLSVRTWSKTILRVGSEVDAIVRRVYSSSSFTAKHNVALV